MTGWEWTEHAACAGHERIFFPLVDLDACRIYEAKRKRAQKATQDLVDRARAICARCPVYDDCAAQRDASNELGMWAGQMRHERTAPRRAAATMQTATVIELRPRPAKPNDTRHTAARERAAEAYA